MNLNQQRIETSPSRVSGGVASRDLDKLEADLVAKRKLTAEKGLVEDLKPIDTALGKIREARDGFDLSQKIVNSQARLGQFSNPTEAKPEAASTQQTISDAQAKMIMAIRSVPSAQLANGELFASMSGKEPSNISYMKTNIQGLFDLVDLKNS